MRAAGLRRMATNASPATQLLLSSGQIPASDHAAKDQISFARAFVYRMTSAWWRVLTAGHHRSQPLRELFSDVGSLELSQWDASSADEKGKALAGLNTDLAVDQIGLSYTSLLPRDYRATHGIYYTPPVLVRRLIDQAGLAGVDWRSARVLDPACGGGAFLAPVACRIVRELRECSARILLESIGTRLHGYEIDPFGAWLSQVTLDAVLLPIVREAGKRLPVVVTVCDSLHNGSSGGQFDLVIGNPHMDELGWIPQSACSINAAFMGMPTSTVFSRTLHLGKQRRVESLHLLLRPVFLRENISRICELCLPARPHQQRLILSQPAKASLKTFCRKVCSPPMSVARQQGASRCMR